MPNDERFTRLWTQAQPVVAGYLSSMVPDFHGAEDLLQNVAVVLLRKFPEYDEKRPFAAWALGIAKLEVLAARRSHARSFLTFHPDIADAVAAAFEEMAPALAQRSQALRECLSEVKGHALQIVALRYQESLPPRDIAAKLGMAAGHVRVILSRLRAALLSCVERRVHAQGGGA
jgi:RNA polymerase sigma-70 factor (ECF subfamily)